ncbi:MAG TPA: hypothetical protein HA254_00830 [Candidatus Diapherotrites archaeon]|uniref:DOD-type homing endonuclease domain-containing protein n=1 Tax=Candidatus Iainarchaeum sp. TaxID=3101447 RepID=A0A7J4IUK7_9ARCH|nr:hypothetical protein [Candidatus Diapherotrites archaeon]
MIQGLFDTDGCVSRFRDLSFSNISILLIKDLQRLLLIFGIVARIRKRKGRPIQMDSKSYETKDHYELIIAQKESILAFRQHIGFRIQRKQAALEEVATAIQRNIRHIFCPVCGYLLFKDLFCGRTKSHETWGAKKLAIIQCLGKEGCLSSKVLEKKLGFPPYKKMRRLNHHFELLKRTRVGNEKFWELNPIGHYIYELTKNNFTNFNSVFSLNNCPLCNETFEKKIKGNWRAGDFEGDIFWDILRKATKESGEKYPFVYDVVLPSDGSNDHFFAAEGFLIHNSAGVNLPAFRVIIQSPYRYTDFGMDRIPISEFRQMSGRAGRPKYDSEGQAVLIAKTEFEKDDYISYYVNGETEPCRSRLSSESALRFHLLATIASGFIFDLESAEKFFSATLYAKQEGDLSALFSKINTLTSQLRDMGFVELSEKRIDATLLGRRVAQLYLDPVSAFAIVNSLRKEKYNDAAYLYTIANTNEFFPYLSVPRQKEGELWEAIQGQKGLLAVNVELEMFTDNSMLPKFWTSLMLKDWIGEVKEQEIVETYKVQPGILRAKLQNADWLAYSSFELAKILLLEGHFGPLAKMRKRLQGGIREELIPLCELRGIGRVRARRMYNAGIKGIAEVKKTDVQDLGKLLGEKVAASVKRQLAATK